MAGKNIKLDEKAINDILVADTDSESGSEASDIYDCLAVDEVIVKFKDRVIFRQYIPKKRKSFGIKIYKLCDESGESVPG
jgi:hypothetical protein